MTTLGNLMRGGDDLNARRKNVINLAFSVMDRDGFGAIEPEVLLSTYQAAKHPDVISKKMSAEAALSEFLNTFDVGSEVEGKVTKREFENYYKKISYSIPDDETFETIIRGLYGINSRQGNDQVSAMSRLLAQKEADATILALNLAKDRERQQRTDQLNSNSKMVLNRLTGHSNTRVPTDQSAGILGKTLNSPDKIGIWNVDSNSIAVATAGPNASSVSASHFQPRSMFQTPAVAIPAGVAHIVGKMKAKLRTYGAHGFVGLQRAVLSMDRGDKKRISMTDFKIAMKQVDVGLSEAEVRMLFDYFNDDHRGTIDSENFIKNVRTALSEKRLILVKQAFAKLDLNGEGAIDAAKVASMYDASSTPDVIAGRTSSDKALREFLETFDVGGEIDGMVTVSEFINYYTNIGGCVDSDEYFELMVRNAWHLGGERQETSKRVLVTRNDGSQYIEEVEDHSQDEDSRGKVSMLAYCGMHNQTFNVFRQTNDFTESVKSYKNPQTRPLIEVSQDRHVITNDTPPSTSTFLRPPNSEAQRVPLGADEAIAAMGPSTSPKLPKTNAPQATTRTPSYGLKHIIAKLRNEIRSLGVLGFIGLQRRFRAIDRDNSKLLSLSDFKKAMRQMNMTLTEGELRILFEYYDEENCGLINHDLFVQSVRSPLTGLRLSLVTQAFNQLDKDGSGLLDAAEVATLYDATRHPDAIRGSASPQQVLSSFLETFDVGCVVPGKVAFREFVNYYSNISESVENDDYFELMIRNVWHVQGQSDASSSAAGRRILKTKLDGSQYVEETKEERAEGLLDSAELAQRAAVVAKLQGRVPSGLPDGGSMVTADSVHKQVQPNKRRTYRQHSTVGLLVDTTVKQRVRTDRGHVQPSAGEQVVLDRLKDEMADRGSCCLVSLLRAFRAADSDTDKLLTALEFKQALSDVNIGLSGPEIRILFAHFDPSATGLVQYDQIMTAVKNPMSAWRLDLVKKAFAGLDREGTDSIEASRCALSYNAANHPEVTSGRMTAERALKEFLEGLDASGGTISEHTFIEYYSAVSSGIESDQYFELMLRSTWNSKEHAIEEKESSEFPLPYSRNSKVREPSSIPIAAGGTKTHSPQGLGNPAHPGWLGSDVTSQFEGCGERVRRVGREPNHGERMIINNLRRELGQRPPVYGYIALQRSFRSLDSDKSYTVPLSDFIRACRDLDLGMTDTESRVIFEHFDRKGMGLMDYRDFIEGVRPGLSRDRLDLVTTAFKCLDRQGAGAIDAARIVNAYDPTGHPDVFLGTKSADAVMREWLDTFDVGGSVVGKVTQEEFVNYYANIGATVDNEDYFELMLIHAWKPQRDQKAEQRVEENEDFEDFGPDSYSRNHSVTFDVPPSESPKEETLGAYHSGPWTSDSMSASMQNWMSANGEQDHQIANSTRNRQAFHRKSQIHFP